MVHVVIPLPNTPYKYMVIAVLSLPDISYKHIGTYCFTITRYALEIHSQQGVLPLPDTAYKCTVNVFVVVVTYCLFTCMYINKYQQSLGSK